jgi:hypothetical protein
MSGSTTTINSIPPPPVVPTTASVTQPTCAVQSGSISVTTQSGVEYSLDGTTYQASNTFSGLTPNDYTLYVQSTSDNTCVTMSSSVITINAVPSSCCSNSIKHDTAYLWYAIRNDCIFDSNRVEYSLDNISVLEYVLRAGSK